MYHVLTHSRLSLTTTHGKRGNTRPPGAEKLISWVSLFLQMGFHGCSWHRCSRGDRMASGVLPSFQLHWRNKLREHKDTNDQARLCQVFFYCDFLTMRQILLLQLYQSKPLGCTGFCLAKVQTAAATSQCLSWCLKSFRFDKSIECWKLKC